MCSENSYVEILAPKLTIFADRAFREIIKVERGLIGLASL